MAAPSPNPAFKRKLATLPTAPGVYMHLDDKGKVLYVGKAKNLRSRVRSYFQTGPKHTTRIDMMVKHVADISIIVTRNEVEALLLESNFIKQHRPPYNVVLRDDKHYLFIKITVGDEWPRVQTVRQTGEKGGRYFGPFTSAGKMRDSLKTLRKVFPWCDDAWKMDVSRNRRPCFNHRLGLCPGACVGKISPEQYRENIDGLIRYLEGDTKDLHKQMTAQMHAAAAAHDFERAAALRDRLECLAALQQDQQAVNVRGGSRDVVGLARDEGHAVVTLLSIRHGRVVARQEFSFWGEGEAASEEVIDSFLGQYYRTAVELLDVPDEVLIPLEAENAAVVSALLSEQRGKKVVVERPQRGERRRLLELAGANAQEHLRQLREKWLADSHQTAAALGDLQRELGLPEPPERIECYDISNLTGTATVASMVVFVSGQAAKAHYRRFQIKHVKGIDDFASMREVLTRRFRKLSAPDEKRSDIDAKPTDESFAAAPNLIIIDGGKGQVSAASDIMAELGLSNIPLIGLAKRQEEVIRRDEATGEFTSMLLPHDSQGLYLLQRVRDEAHRFAITYNRNLRSKAGIRSALDDIPGIGPTKKKLLMRKFGSVRAIREAEVGQLQEVVGKAAGRVVKENL